MKRREFMASAGALTFAAAAGAKGEDFSGRVPRVSAPLGKDEIESMAADLVARMTLKEKVRQMSGHLHPRASLQLLGYGKFTTFDVPGVKRLGVPSIRFIDGPRGINFHGSTAFPVSMCRGATWDPDLEERIGEAMGYEARAGGANFTGAVCVNLLRRPGWGRAQETFGEDPRHLGEMGSAMVRGLQKHIMACVKHYACNSIEESRFFVNVKVGERTLREIYLPHFKRCVDEGAASIMSAYNDVNGELCSHNEHLLRDILKYDWGFEGFVISDFSYGVEDTVEAALAGLDVEMPFTNHYGRDLEKAVKDGLVPESVIDEAVTRLTRQKLRFLHLEDNSGLDKEKVAGPEHRALALEAARKGIVLLKNDGGALPLKREELKRVAVIGKLAGAENLGDKGSSTVRPPYVVTPLEGIEEAAGPGIEIVQAGDDPAEAERAARSADAAVVVVGMTWMEEGEYIKEFNIGGDREDLALLPKHVELVRAAARANGRVIVAVEAGSAVTMEEWKDDVPAILMAWYPGMEGGTALAEILFGDVNPSGKLPHLFPKTADQLVPFDNRAREVAYGYFHGYRQFDRDGQEPAFPFGFGLSYTEYEYSGLALGADRVGAGGSARASVTVANRGSMAGEEIVELYVGCRSSRVERAQKDLVAFTRVALGPGEEKRVVIEFPVRDLAYYDESSKRWVVEPGEYEVMVGASSRDSDLLRTGMTVV